MTKEKSGGKKGLLAKQQMSDLQTPCVVTYENPTYLYSQKQCSRKLSRFTAISLSTEEFHGQETTLEMGSVMKPAILNLVNPNFDLKETYLQIFLAFQKAVGLRPLVLQKMLLDDPLCIHETLLFVVTNHRYVGCCTQTGLIIPPCQ